MKSSKLPLMLLWAIGFLAFTCLPWTAQPELGWGEVWWAWLTHPDLLSGGQMLIGQPVYWLSILPIAFLLCAVGIALPTGRSQFIWLSAGGCLGSAGLLWIAFWVGAKAQPSWGVGPMLCVMVFGMLFATGLARWGAFRADAWSAGAVVLIAGFLFLFVAYPLGVALIAAFYDEQAHFSMLALASRLSDERVWSLGCVYGQLSCGVAWNTLWMASTVAIGTTLLGTLLALFAQRAGLRNGGFMQGSLKVLALLPIITPPFVVGLGLILLFGRAGVVNQFLEWAFEINPTRWFYGALGIWTAQMFAFTPIAYLIMRGVVQGIAPSLEEAAQTLGANRWQVFRTVTFPLLKPGIANAVLIGFIESMSDFGNPIVVGGSFSVLATDIFFAIVGAQFDPGRAAGLAWLLTLFALLVFGLQRWLLGQQQFVTVSGKGESGLTALLPKGLQRITWVFALPWLAITVAIYVFAFAGGFVKTWGRDYTLTWQHFQTAFGWTISEFGWIWSGTAWNSLWTTLKLSSISAPISALLGLVIAWVLARQTFYGRRWFEFSAMLAFAIPGTVLGVSYVMAFNVAPIELTGTGTLIVLCFVFRNLPVGVRAGSATFEQLDKSLEEASTMLHASTPQTLCYLLLPLLRPALIAALVYSFVRSMTTVSAVIFLVTAENDLATTYILGRVGNGDYGVALAYCTVLMALMTAIVALIHHLVGERDLGRRVVLP
jgi:iron(III) transport system permease protein